MKALALFSGGLDSILAVKLIADQGVEVIALHFDTGFGGAGTKKKHEYLQRVTAKLGVRLEIVDIKEQFVKEVLFKPKYGYGKNFNPCIDCHANMFAWAFKLKDKYGASFFISGEVLGQRPMSQRMAALKQVEKLSGAEGLIVRPLSAKLLPPTIPEKEGWIDREKLLGIEGRGRYVQLELAKKWGITEYETPAGGCLLTDPHFGRKMKDVAKFELDSFDVSDIPLLKTGRHFRLPGGAKLILGRNEKENNFLMKVKTDKYLKLSPVDILGPDGLISSNASGDDILLAASILVTFSKNPEKNIKYKVEVNDSNLLEVTAMNDKEEARKFAIV